MGVALVEAARLGRGTGVAQPEIAAGDARGDIEARE